MRYVVAHVINSPAGAVRTARLVIDGVPDKTPRAAVLEALTGAGKGAEFSEGGVPFGNHDVLAEGRQGWPKGLAGIDAAKVTTWERLTLPPPRSDVQRIVLRTLPAEYAAIKLAAEREGASLQGWCLGALLAAAAGDGAR
jgi:hypothetical protein